MEARPPGSVGSRFGKSPTPFLGYFFLLEDCTKIKIPVRNKEPYFKVDPAFDKASYSKRYQLLCRRPVLERVYSAACLVMATNAPKTGITQPASECPASFAWADAPAYRSSTHFGG